MEATPAFGCRIYDDRPGHCRTYPWSDAQILFEECVFMEDGRVVDRKAAEARLGGGEAVDEACRRCGRCCLAWRAKAGRHEPVARCRHLDIPDGPMRAALAALPPVGF